MSFRVRTNCSQMGRQTFTDNVLNLAIENCLVCHIPEIFTPKIVDSMSVERLRELATESETTSARRQVLKDELKVLRQGLWQCRRYRPRPITGEICSCHPHIGTMSDVEIQCYPQALMASRRSRTSLLKDPRVRYNLPDSMSRLA